MIDTKTDCFCVYPSNMRGITPWVILDACFFCVFFYYRLIVVLSLNVSNMHDYYQGQSCHSTMAIK